MNVTELSDKELVKQYASAKAKEAIAKAAAEEIVAEIERRNIGEIEDGLTNFKRIAGDEGTFTVYKKGTFKLISPLGLKRFIGVDLFNSEFKIEKVENYKPKTAFEAVLKAIGTGDYDFSISFDEILDSMEIKDEKQRKVLRKRLKGVPEKDYNVLTSVLGKGDYDTEVFLFSKVLNAEKILTFFPDADEEFLTKLRRYFFVAESLGTAFSSEV